MSERTPNGLTYQDADRVLRDAIEAYIYSRMAGRELPDNWPGSVSAANDIMDRVRDIVGA